MRVEDTHLLSYITYLSLSRLASNYAASFKETLIFLYLISFTFDYRFFNIFINLLRCDIHVVDV